MGSNSRITALGKVKIIFVIVENTVLAQVIQLVISNLRKMEDRE